MLTTYLILRRQTVYSREEISSFRNRQKMLFVYEYCLMCYNKCLIFISNQEKRTCQHVRYISVSDTISRHKGPFWSVMFPLSVNSSKFSTEVLYTKFDLPYFVKEMSNWKEIWQESLHHICSNMSKNGENRWFSY